MELPCADLLVNNAHAHTKRTRRMKTKTQKKPTFHASPRHATHSDATPQQPQTNRPHTHAALLMPDCTLVTRAGPTIYDLHACTHRPPPACAHSHTIATSTLHPTVSHPHPLPPLISVFFHAASTPPHSTYSSHISFFSSSLNKHADKMDGRGSRLGDQQMAQQRKSPELSSSQPTAHARLCFRSPFLIPHTTTPVSFQQQLSFL